MDKEPPQHSDASDQATARLAPVVLGLCFLLMALARDWLSTADEVERDPGSALETMRARLH